MEIFSYDEAVAGSAHGDLQSVMAGLEGSLSDLSGFVSRVKANWEGDEQQSYGEVQAKWDTASQTVQGILSSVHQALGSTTSSVQAMRGQVRSAIHAS